MKGKYEHTPRHCRFCGSAPRLHTAWGLFWYECDTYPCARTRTTPDAFTSQSMAFLAWDADQTKED